jgi:nitrogen-specific signal transduction histidine kinase
VEEMNARSRKSPHRVLLSVAVLALVIASALVAYLERRAADLQSEQTHVIVQQVCERTATALSARIRHLLDSAFFETIEGIGHPQMMEYDLPRIATYFADGHRRHPYVDRFFIWSANRSPLSSDQVVFFSPDRNAPNVVAPIALPDGKELGWFMSIPELGREILRVARAESDRRTFLVVERTIGQVPYQLIVHPLWSTDRRQEFSGLIGYTVDLRKIDTQMFQRLLDAEVTSFLNPDSRPPRLAATLIDEKGKVVYGETVVTGAPAASVPLDMLFFPHQPLNQWLAGRPPVRSWQVVVSAAGPIVYGHFPGKWLVAGVVLLIIVAVFCAVSVERQAVRLSRMQADFVANASHQLKTPLSLLSTAIETLTLDRVPPDRMKEYFKILQAQTRRMTGLVERILQFSRVEAGPKAYRMASLNLVPIVEDVVDQFRTESQSRVPIVFERGSAVLMARADAAALEVALVNLLENAVKFGDDRNRVTVRVARSDGHAAISVRDQGVGIHSTDLPHIFDKFYRGRNGGEGRPGFGLGLALVDSIARAHGGRATVQTSYHDGSEFTVVIPVLPDDDHAISDSAH